MLPGLPAGIRHTVTEEDLADIGPGSSMVGVAEGPGAAAPGAPSQGGAGGGPSGGAVAGPGRGAATGG